MHGRFTSSLSFDNKMLIILRCPFLTAMQNGVIWNCDRILLKKLYSNDFKKFESWIIFKKNK